MASILNNSEWLEVGHSLKSENGRIELKVQSDGRLALYHHGQCVFQNTAEQRNDIKGLKMQKDGNLCLFTKHGKAIWQTDTAYPKGDHSVACIVQDDGNVILLRGDRVIWSSHIQLGVSIAGSDGCS